MRGEIQNMGLREQQMNATTKAHCINVPVATLQHNAVVLLSIELICC